MRELRTLAAWQQEPSISVVVPVYNGAAVLERCLEALAGSRGVTWECIVVDDGSTDGSGEVARRLGARVLTTPAPRSGPGQARNLGSLHATAPLLCFIDADVVVGSNTLADFVTLFNSDTSLSAAFGSYDAEPAVREHLSQYRNLLHHFVHQTGEEAASTFWSGCGAIRKDVFVGMGGFDAAYARPSIEDIELGYRLRAADHRIRLAKHIQVKHLKRWSFWGILRTDIFDRALPWTRLIQRTGKLPNDLNLKTSSRASAMSVYALAALTVLGCLGVAPAWLLTIGPLAVLFACNRDLYAFLWRQQGAVFLMRSLPMHWLYFGYSALAFAVGTLIGPGERHRSGATRGHGKPLSLMG